jgi:hypothetical protein
MCLDKFNLALLFRKVNLDDLSVPDRQTNRVDLFELGVVGKILLYCKRRY